MAKNSQMSSKAEQDWEAFRRYTYPAVEITQTPNFIIFSQWERSAHRTFLFTLFLGALSGVIAIVCLVITIAISIALSLGIGGLFLIFPVVGIVVYVIFKIFMKRTITFNTLIISPGHVTWDSQFLNKLPRKQTGTYRFGSLELPWRLSDKPLVIPLGQIKSIDVRQGDSVTLPSPLVDWIHQKHHIVIWHGPVPVRTIVAPSQENGFTLKEGIVAAIGVMNPESTNIDPSGKRQFAE